jgi:hypothetical protein
MRADGRPDCTVNPAIDKDDGSFTFQPAGCTGSACNRVRALILSNFNSDPIPEGSVLLTCNLDSTGVEGTYSIPLSGTILADPTSTRVCGPGVTDLRCTNHHGMVHVLPSTGAPTRTPTRTRTPTPTPTPSPTASATHSPTPTVLAAPGVAVGTTQGVRGRQTSIPVFLQARGNRVAALQLDLGYDSRSIRIRSNSGGEPNCVVNPDIHKPATAFGFVPAGCDGAECVGVRAIVLSVDNVRPIPEGASLFRCTIEVPSATTAGSYPVVPQQVILSGPTGEQICRSGGDFPCTGDAGAVLVVDRGCLGDCNGDGRTSVDELVTIINIVLGTRPIASCSAADSNGDGEIKIDDVLAAVRIALNGCPPHCSGGWISAQDEGQ